MKHIVVLFLLSLVLAINTKKVNKRKYETEGEVFTNNIVRRQKNADLWEEVFNMEVNIEGGLFSETYKSPETVGNLPSRYGSNATRSMSTHIYYLLRGDEFSAFHQLDSDEIWHWYYGSTLELYVIQKKDGRLRIDNLGPEYAKFVTTVSAGDWYAAKLKHPKLDHYCLLGITVAPGFELIDFRFAEAEELIKTYPQHEKIIWKLAKHQIFL